MDIFSTYSIECGKLRSSGRALCGLAAETLRLRIGPRSYLPAGLRRAGCSRNIQESCRAIVSVALRIAYPARARHEQELGHKNGVPAHVEASGGRI